MVGKMNSLITILYTAAEATCCLPNRADAARACTITTVTRACRPCLHPCTHARVTRS